MVSDKASVQRLVTICYKMGLRQVVISPGSRNAPLIISFNGHGGFRCRNVTDERVAGFVGLGLSLNETIPAILICTSGTAALNYAPAIAEAYYQKVPLLVLTADRPEDRIDEGIGQTIRQNEVYNNYIKSSFQLNNDGSTMEDLILDDRKIMEAIRLTMDIDPGPIHINIPLDEPLYGQMELEIMPRLNIEPRKSKENIKPNIEKLQSIWKSNKQRLAIVGQINDSDKSALLYECLKDREDLIVLSESVSNFPGKMSIRNIDRALDAISNDTVSYYYPELIISFGNAVVSKKIKKFLEHASAKFHWHIDETDIFRDTYKSLSHKIAATPEEILSQLTSESDDETTKNYIRNWTQLDQANKISHDGFMNQCTWSDLLVFDRILKAVSSNCVLHLSNSTPIRYAQLFDYPSNVTYRSNRGVGGIDGCTSTAVGCALEDDRDHLLITGDLAFIYDSNALWVAEKPKNLKIIVINNGGGGIFRIIPGPSETIYLEKDFEARHDVRIADLAKAFQVPHIKAENEHELKNILNTLLSKEEFGIFEIVTPIMENDIVLKDYFNYIKQNAFAHA